MLPALACATGPAGTAPAAANGSMYFATDAGP
jgi:hypothetical protein